MFFQPEEGAGEEGGGGEEQEDAGAGLRERIKYSFIKYNWYIQRLQR